MDQNNPDSTTPDAGPQAPANTREIDRLLAASVAYRDASDAMMGATAEGGLAAIRAAVALQDTAANEVLGAADAIRSLARLTPAEEALIVAARAYAAHKRQNEAAGRLGSTYATERAVDAVLDACLELVKSEER